MGWRFYVYELVDADGSPAYVGKGSGRRLSAQMRKFGLIGNEVARFRRERDAYAYERKRIAEAKPALNRHPGGNGSRAARAPRPVRFDFEIAGLTTQQYAARLVLRYGARTVDPSKIDALRRVAYGARA